MKVQSVKIVKESERRKKNPIKGRRKSGSPHKKCEKIALKRAKIVSNRQIVRQCAWNRNVGTPNRKFPKLATAVVTQKEGKNAEQKEKSRISVRESERKWVVEQIPERESRIPRFPKVATVHGLGEKFWRISTR